MSLIGGISYGMQGTPYASGYGFDAISKTGAGADAEKAKGATLNPGESVEKAPGRKSSPAECETCKNRKYQDGSDEMVSFKSASHISPEAAPAKVRAHEQEHVVNAYEKAKQNNGEVVSCGVAIHTSVCPECGRTYVSGGTTTTQIKYANEENPYQKDLKSAEAANKWLGANINLAV
ncbi:MAG: hypothetical protein IJV29_07700 [Butyrivibrio sp.]|nr:hypothetical protein [Butyrivibrio sp.]